jgi:hypothetical protein
LIRRGWRQAVMPGGKIDGAAYELYDMASMRPIAMRRSLCPPSSSLWKHWNLILEIDATWATFSPEPLIENAEDNWASRHSSAFGINLQAARR